MTAAVRTQRHRCRDAFAATLTQLAEADPRIVAVVNDSVCSSKLGGFRERLPEPLINVGIAEQTRLGRQSRQERRYAQSLPTLEI